MNQRDLEINLQALFDGNLDPAARDALQDELRNNPAAKDAYRDYSRLHNAMQLRNEGVDLLKVIPIEHGERQKSRNWFKVAALAATIALFAGTMLMNFPEDKEEQQAIVSINASPGTSFNLNHNSQSNRSTEGDVMFVGSRLQVARGSVELSFPSGVQALIKAPADLSVLSEAKLWMGRGDGWFNVPSGAEGFLVHTPEFSLKDLGTQFGVRSDPLIPDEVHVFMGSVELGSQQGDVSQEILRANEARKINEDGKWVEIPVTNKHFFNKLPSTQFGMGNIIWISASGDGSVPKDWRHVLEKASHRVSGLKIADIEAPSSEEIQKLNKADLVIFGPNSKSINGADTWNSLSVPLLLMSAYVTDNWNWAKANPMSGSGSRVITIADTKDPIWVGVEMPLVGSLFKQNARCSEPVLANGSALATGHKGSVAIARWKAGSITDSCGPRLFFAGALDAEKPSFHLTKTGEQVFLNAVQSMLDSVER